MPEIVTDVDTSRPSGADNSTRYLGAGGEESNKGITDWKAGATAEGDRQAQINKSLAAAYGDYIHNGVSVETFGRNLGVPAISAGGREVPVTVMLHALGAVDPSPYGQELNNPNLAPEFKEMLRKMYPHKAPVTALPLPGNRITPYLSKGLGKRNLLKESFDKYTTGELTAEQFKGVADWAFKDDSMLDAIAWEKNLQRGYDTVLQSGPDYNVDYSKPRAGIPERVINAITGKLPEMGIKTSPWERIAPGFLSGIGHLIEQAGAPEAPNPKAREHYEAMKHILPKDVFERIEKDHKDWSDDRKALEVNQILANRVASRRAESMSGVDAAKGTVGSLASAVPSLVATGVVTPLLGPYTAGVALLEQTGAALTKTLAGRLLLKKGAAAAATRAGVAGAGRVLKGTTALGRYPGAAVSGAAVMSDFVGGTKTAQELAHPTENSGNPYEFEPGTAAMGAAFGVGGAALGHGWNVWRSKTTAAADIVADLTEEHPSPPPLEDPAPGEKVEPRDMEAVYKELHALHEVPLAERRPRTDGEAARLKELSTDAQLAQNFIRDPKQLDRNLSGWAQNIVLEMDAGISSEYLHGDPVSGTASLEEKLGVFKDASGKLPADLEAALTKAYAQSLPGHIGTSEGAIEQRLLQARTNKARAKAGHVLVQDKAVHTALTYLDTEGKVGPPLRERVIAVEGRKDPATGRASKVYKKQIGLTEKEKAEVQASLDYYKVHAPETAKVLEETLTHFQHLSGDLAKPHSEEKLAAALADNPEVLTALDIPPGKIDLARVHPDYLEEAKTINAQIEHVDSLLPIHYGRSRFKDNTETLRKPNVLEELNKDHAKGAAFKYNNDVKDWHRKEMGSDFEPLEDIVFNTETKKFEKNTEIPERTDDPDSTDNPPCLL
jgi:hypothetical protein